MQLVGLGTFRGATLMSHATRVPAADDLLSSHRNGQTDAQVSARTNRSKGTRGAIFVLSHATPNRTSVCQPVPDQPVSLEFCLPFRRGDQWRVGGAECWDRGIP